MRIVIAEGETRITDLDVRDAGEIGTSGVHTYQVRAIDGRKCLPDVLCTVTGMPDQHPADLAASVLRVVPL